MKRARTRLTWKKFEKKSWNFTMKYLAPLSIVLLLVVNVASLFIIPYSLMTGYHNADLAFNMHRIDMLYGTDIVHTACDVLIDGSACLDYPEIYRTGMSQMIGAAIHGAVMLFLDICVFFVWIFLVRPEQARLHNQSKGGK